MRYKILWKDREAVPLVAELVPSPERAKARAHDLLREHGRQAHVEIWNEEETWQFVTRAGIAEWSEAFAQNGA